MGVPDACMTVAATAVTLAAVALGLLRMTSELALFRVPAGSAFFGWPAPRGAFEPVGEGLFKLDLPWYVTPFHRETLDLYAMELGAGRWALSDAGGYDTPLQRHASTMAAALAALMGADGTLSLVLLTHGHVDHVGALPLLLQRYPAMQVVFHETEAPYLVEGRAWAPPWDTHSSAGSRVAHLARFLPPRQYQLPRERGVTLSGASGDLAHLGAPGLTWHHTPGHAPSHVVYAHAPSRSLLGGDIADLLLDPPGVTVLPDGRRLVAGQPTLLTLTVFHGSDAAVAAASLCRVAYDERIAFDTLRPYHDATKRGLTRAQLRPLAEAAAHCGGVAPADAV